QIVNRCCIGLGWAPKKGYLGFLEINFGAPASHWNRPISKACFFPPGTEGKDWSRLRRSAVHFQVQSKRVPSMGMGTLLVFLRCPAYRWIPSWGRQILHNLRVITPVSVR
ncbi:unnamed protein product, partial [Ectocarpus sp. 12 AP-2014]